MLVGGACALLCWLLSYAAWVRELEHQAYDNCLGVRGPRASTAKVVIVALDDQSFETIPKPLRLFSPELGQVVQYLHRQGVASIGVDVFMPDPGNQETIDLISPNRPGDAQAMGRAVGQAGNVVLPILIRDRRTPLLPMYEWVPPGDPDWADLGFVELVDDADWCVRRQKLKATDLSGRLYPCLAVAVLTMAGGLAPPQSAEEPLCLDDRPIPLDRHGDMRINYVGPPGTIPSVPLTDVLEAAQGKRTLQQDWQGAMVLIGVTAGLQEDKHPVPRMNRSLLDVLASTWHRHELDQMPGVEIHANTIATLADRRFFVTPWWLSTPLLLILAGAGLGMAFTRLTLEAGAALLIAYLAGWLSFCLLLFRYTDWPVEQVAMYFLGVLLYGVVFALRWRWIRRMMGMMKSEAVARALEAGAGKLDLRGEQREITVLFTDVRNFTDFSESHPAADVVRLLNEFFAAAVPLIEAEGGIVNQYLGDGMMVLFGAPELQPDHALRAVRAALAILSRVHQLAGRWKDLGAEAFRIGIGIHTGKAVVGTVGSPRRLDYTAIGDTVNTAARIESCNKQLHSELLVSQSTLAALSEADRQRLAPAWESNTLSVKGKREPLTVYALRGT
jgi:class 3 adenylate cyclase